MKTLTLALLMVCFFSASSQNWCPPGASWYYRESCVEGFGYEHLFYSNDTVINGITCKEVLITGYYQQGHNGVDTSGPRRVYTYESRDTIYYWCGTEFSPFIYLNAQVGDMLKILNCGNGAIISTIVDSIGKIVINNDSLRYYYFHFTDPCYQESGEVIERIGYTNSIMVPDYEPSCIVGACYNWLTCYADDSFPVYVVDTAYDCYGRALDINENYANNFMIIRPNPASDYTTINYSIANWNNESLSLIVSNLLGQVVSVQSLNPSGSVQAINISGFAAGIYNVAIKRKDAIIAVARMVKQ